MSFNYNKSRFKEFAYETGKTSGQIGRIVGITNPTTPQGWLNGGDIRVETLLRFVSKTGIHLLEFFQEDGKPMHELYTKVSDSPKNEDIQSSISSIEHVREMAELEKQHLKEMMQKDIDLAKKEVEMTDRIREKVKAEFDKDRQQIIESYEARLRSRDNDVAKLQQQLAELTAQYKELETMNREGGYFPKGTITGLAEKPYGVR